ncbi:Rqc2 family fibronectin-binding protein [Bacillus benzoevorans]|uniref:Rqc2 homolog RqcH n=1 Tax=Bacillus benzoevorans TaxID=1456 RepID=A0A7X0HN77_9BACI|nr:NFACT RNA binding domain-containing protein [Bacillus benzoevorans]MBB6443778.1 putative ribosome quality control (RQC) complex YloA/Tae2 family protein [Bacillus benzoevorans]
MSFDGLFTRAMTKELTESIKGGRINKIHQPYQHEMIMVVRANGKNHKLLISAHPAHARVQLTEEGYDNPAEPPMFCMLLRKHLEGYILEDIHQHGLDRIIIFDIKGRNEIGDTSYKKLIVEIMGRHSNIILLDQSRNMILDCIKHVSFAINSYRAVLPGQEYIFPPEQHKADPFAANEEDILSRLDFNAGKIDKQIISQYSGISPLFAKEITHQAGLVNRTTVPKAFLSLIERINAHDYAPSIMNSGDKENFYLFPLGHVQGESKSFPSFSLMLDHFYFGKAERDRVKQQAHDIERFIINEKEKNEKKIIKLQETIKEAEEAQKYQLFGELVTANIYAVQKGMESIEVVNYYDENGATVVIPLHPLKTPAENAQKYFTKYQKAKTALSIVHEQIEKAETEAAYFDALLQQVETASAKDIAEIREELIEEGYIKARKKKQMKKNQSQKPVLDRFFASDGTEIIIGKNNKQNDYLTNRFAARDEIWLHTKDIPGSHVVIRSKSPKEKTIHEAAILAAFYSKARNSSSVPVDFTLVRHVKKPSGAKPGFVIYDNQQTVFVTPDAEIVQKLKKQPTM